MKQKLLSYGKRTVYPFTDERNVEYINSAGCLLPRSEITGPFIPGGNQWSIDADDRSGMDHYIHLCFLQQHPMEYIARTEGRIDIVWLKISTEVLEYEGVLYCPGVSNESEMVFYNKDEAKAKLDLDILFTFNDWSVDDNHDRRKIAEKYEILVPSAISTSMIIGGL